GSAGGDRLSDWRGLALWFAQAAAGTHRRKCRGARGRVEWFGRTWHNGDSAGGGFATGTRGCSRWSISGYLNPTKNSKKDESLAMRRRPFAPFQIRCSSGTNIVTTTLVTCISATHQR